MRVKVRPMRKEGQLLVSSESPKSPGFAGILTVGEARDHISGRTLVRASLTGISSSAGTDLLPELFDARLIWARDSKLRVVGFERIGAAEFAQTWTLEVISC